MNFFKSLIAGLRSETKKGDSDYRLLSDAEFFGDASACCECVHSESSLKTCLHDKMKLRPINYRGTCGMFEMEPRLKS